MVIIEKRLEMIFKEAWETIFGEQLENIEVSMATNPKFGDFQTNVAMTKAKALKDNPRNIATKLAENFPANELVEKLEVAGPGFINITLKEKILTSEVEGKLDYDFSFLNRGGKVIIDYSSPNIAKRMHIGHLRSTVIGDSIKRLYNYLGYETIADNHIGDWGTQFGKLIIGYRRWLDKEVYAKNPVEELERVYVEFAKAAEENPALEDEAREELKKLQNGDPENNDLWKEFIKVSLESYDKTYKRLGIEFDTYYGESFYHDMMLGVVEELVKKGLAVDEDGTKVIHFSEEDKLHPCIVQKRDGAYLYSTSDIATIKFKLSEYDVNKLVYITDERQQDHFKQFFKITDMLGWEVEKDHIWFGIMRFADGIFSTRKGNIIKLEDLLDEAKKRAYEIVEEKNPSLSPEEKENIAEVVGVGAIKYGDLSQNRQSPVIFDWDKVLSFEGNTSPYLQYSYARIKSIIRKGTSEGNKLDENARVKLIDPSERNLALYLTQFPKVILKSAELYRPNLLAEYLYELAKKFNSFYAACQVLNNEDEDLVKSRLILIDKVSEVLKTGLDLMGIKTVERM